MPNQAFEPDEQLTAIAIGYKNDKANYIGDKILPYVPVEAFKIFFTTNSQSKRDSLFPIPVSVASRPRKQ